LCTSSPTLQAIFRRPSCSWTHSVLMYTSRFGNCSLITRLAATTGSKTGARQPDASRRFRPADYTSVAGYRLSGWLAVWEPTLLVGFQQRHSLCALIASDAKRATGARRGRHVAATVVARSVCQPSPVCPVRSKCAKIGGGILRTLFANAFANRAAAGKCDLPAGRIWPAGVCLAFTARR
jgi:hypothetical protein